MSVSTITGRCVCARYTITIPKTKQMNLCHCTDCRRWAGSMYSAHIAADNKQLKIEGPEPRTFTVKGVDGNDMVRAWCDGCGSGLWIRPAYAKDQTYIKAGLFEPGDIPLPSTETFTKNMESWERKAEGAKHFEQNRS